MVDTITTTTLSTATTTTTTTTTAPTILMVVSVNGGWWIVAMAEIAGDSCRLCHPHVISTTVQPPAFFWRIFRIC